MDKCAIAPYKPDCASQNDFSPQSQRKVIGKNFSFFLINNISGKRDSDQPPSLDIKQLRSGKIYLLDPAFEIKSEIADRCKIEQFRIVVT